jgi:ABC-2 type transport system permease protein
MALLPTLIYFSTVYYLAEPTGNVDVAGTFGSFIGLFLLASVYSAIGVFASAMTDNQIVAFILAALLSFFFYMGFDALGGLKMMSEIGNIIVSFGISEHYASMSRGVIDSRDVIYFLSAIALFLFLSRVKIQSRKWA